MNSGSTTATDIPYGQTAVSLGFVSETQVQECIQIQTRMREMGIDEPLGEIMSKKGYITAQAHSSVLKKLGVQVSPIPGYTILGKIGQGGMGAVYKALQTSVNRVVAIKILSPNAVKDKTYVSRFFQEAQAAAALNHKNLIAAIDVGAAGGLYYFVMEYVVGKSCRELLNAKGPFDEKKAMDIAAQMAEVLDHIHQHSMVHRDIKPENILLPAEGVVKLCDLGLAKSTVTAEQSLTQEGFAVGTPYFMSPEQVRGEKDVDIRADLYSLGATLYFLATGKHPFEGKSAAETMSLHLNTPAPDPRKIVPALREDFAMMVHKLMAKDRKDRYQKPLDLLDDLKKLQAGSAPQHARQHATKIHLQHKAQAAARLNARKSRARLPYFVVAAAAALVAGFLVFFVAGGSASGPTHPRAESPIVKAPPPPMPSTPRTPEPPKDDPAHAAEASRLYAIASDHFLRERWSEAKTEFEKLLDHRGPYVTLLFTQELSKTIGEKIGVCENRLREQSSAKARQIDEARAAMHESRWKEAHDRFQLLAKGGEVGLEPDINRCRHELDAQAAVDEFRAAVAAGTWIAARVKWMELGQKYRETEAVEKHKDDLWAVGMAVLHEIEAADHLGKARAAVVAGGWVDLTKALSKLEELKETKTCRANEAEIGKLRAQLEAAKVKQGEDIAKQSWVDATGAYDRDMADKKYDEAQQALRSFASNHALTKFYEQKKSEVDAKIADAGRRRAADREADARKFYQQLAKDMKEAKYAEAVSLINRLLSEYADTATVKSNDKQIQTDKVKCQQSVGIPDNVQVLLEFEDFPGNWRTMGGSKAEAENREEAYQGKRAAHLKLPPTCRAIHPIHGIKEGAEAVFFWARSIRKAPVALVDFAIMDDQYAFHANNLQITNEWKEFRVRFSDLRPMNDQLRNKVSLNLNKAHEFSFAPVGEGRDGSGGLGIEILVDSLRVEGRK